MKRPGTMRLAIMGGGAVLAIGGGVALWPGESEACRRARELGGADVAVACRSSSSSSSSSGTSGGSGGHASSSGGVAVAAAGGGADAGATSRGGFGSSAHASSGS